MFYAAEDADENWIIVDGIQRLTAIARFIAPETVESWAQPLTLQGLQYLKKQYENASFHDLPGRLQTRLLETQVVMHLIRQGTPEAAMFNIFTRINTGGRILTRQELRHALIPGPARDLLRELAQSKEFLIATGGRVLPTRMDDREMVLRFIAFRLTPPDSYKPEMDDFLQQAMRETNHLPATAIDDIREDFSRAMTAAHAVFGKYAFRKVYQGKNRRSPINKALFETISVGLARLSPSELDTLHLRRRQALDGLAALLSGNIDFERSISVGTGATARVRARFGAIEKMFREILDAQ
jgi:hypothetical protein